MLLSITTTHRPATDLGYLLHKHPDRYQRFELSFGAAHIYFPEASPERCSACLLLDVDPVRLVRGKGDRQQGLLDQYVNDRPYVASSLMSVAIAQVFGAALGGRSKERPELARTPIPLVAKIDTLPVRGGDELIKRIFQPLDYRITSERHPLDEQFPGWGKSPYHSVQLEQTIELSRLLQHLYVLMPVFDMTKHYYIGQDEVEKLLAKAHDWLADHPERELIAHRYLLKQPGLARQALARLEADDVDEEFDQLSGPQETSLVDERQQSLHEQRLSAVLEALRASGANSVIDLGCGEGKLLSKLLADSQFKQIVGMDVSLQALEIAHRRLKLDRLPEAQRNRIRLHHGSLIYRDDSLQGFDAAAIVEVIEHLDPPRLKAFERVVFHHAHPKTVVLTTPNQEYNSMWTTLPADTMRHSDHRFEWNRQEFAAWANRVAQEFDYRVRIRPIGAEDGNVGAPSQMAIFDRGGR